jgi:hypothetical protein
MEPAFFEVDELESKAWDARLAEIGLRRATAKSLLAAGYAAAVIRHGQMGFDVQKHRVDDRLWRLRTGIASQLDAAAVTDKTQLAEHCEPLIWRHDTVWGRVVAPSVRLRGHQPRSLKGLDHCWIWRPARAWGGTGVVVGCGAEAAHRLRGPLTGLMTVYVESLLLGWRAADFRTPSYGDLVNRALAHPEPERVELRKFHLRVYLIVVVDGEARRAAYVPDATRICFAEAAFTMDDFSAAVHNTRLRGTNSSPIERFDHHLELATSANGAPPAVTRAVLEGRITALLAKTCSVCVPRIKPYAEAEKGYEMYGCDIMVDRDGKPWLLEINKRPGTIGRSPTEGPRCAEILVNAMFDYAIKPLRTGAAPAGNVMTVY